MLLSRPCPTLCHVICICLLLLNVQGPVGAPGSPGDDGAVGFPGVPGAPVCHLQTSSKLPSYFPSKVLMLFLYISVIVSEYIVVLANT